MASRNFWNPCIDSSDDESAGSGSETKEVHIVGLIRYAKMKDAKIEGAKNMGRALGGNKVDLFDKCNLM